MNVHAKGFSLIECIIYCAITSFLSVMLFIFFSRTIAGVRLFSAHQQEIVAQWAVQRILRADIQMASNHPEQWQVSASSLICKVGNECIGWKMQNGNLYRTIGSYNFLNRRWGKKSTALVANNVTHFENTLKENQKLIEAVSYDLHFNTRACHKKIPLLESMG